MFTGLPYFGADRWARGAGLRQTHSPRLSSVSLWPGPTLTPALLCLVPPAPQLPPVCAKTDAEPFSFPRDSPQAAPKSQKADSPSIDYAELLQHFEKVQKKHLEVRHQRSGRGDHLDRRVVL